MNLLIAEAAQQFSQFYEVREELRWKMADTCALVESESGGLAMLTEELENNFGISITLNALKNYARVARAFSEEHRHLQYKFSNYLEWSRHPDPVKAMEVALDNCWGPKQMRNLRLHGYSNYKEEKICERCGKELGEGLLVCRRCLGADFGEERDMIAEYAETADLNLALAERDPINSSD